MMHLWSELHLAIRGVLHAAGFQTFTLHVQATELHPGRVDIKWSLHVPREGLQDGPCPPSLYFSTHEPDLLVEWLKVQLPPKAAPATIAELGELPRSQFPENVTP